MIINVNILPIWFHGIPRNLLGVNYSTFAPSADETQCRVERKY